jgi:hypothetical protein
MPDTAGPGRTGTDGAGPTPTGHRPRRHLLLAILWTAIAAAGVATGTLAAAHHIPLLNEAAVAVFFIGVVAAARSVITFRRTSKGSASPGDPIGGP